MLGVRWFILTLQLCLIVECLADNQTRAIYNCRCGRTNENAPKIINGTEVTPNKYPWMVQVRLRNMIQCGGSIITTRHVLTAAHCTYDKPANRFFIITGAHEINADENGLTKWYNIKSKVEHDFFQTLKNDIALLITDRTIEFNEIVGPVCLPSVPLKMVGQKVKVTGWGRTTRPRQIAEKLLEVVLDVVDFEICRKIEKFQPYIAGTPSQLCLKTPQHSACHGDSGGPGTWLDPETGLHILVGLVSFGHGLCSTDSPNVFTDVNYFLPWIQKHVASFGEGVTTCSKITST